MKSNKYLTIGLLTGFIVGGCIGVLAWAFLQNLFAIPICASIGMLIGIVIGTVIDYEKTSKEIDKIEIVYKHSCRICLCDGIRVSQICISKKEGHFFPAFSMLCIEAGESFPEISTDRISFILGRGKKGQRISCGSRALLPSTVLPGRNRGRCARPVRP